MTRITEKKIQRYDRINMSFVQNEMRIKHYRKISVIQWNATFETEEEIYFSRKQSSVIYIEQTDTLMAPTNASKAFIDANTHT